MDLALKCLKNGMVFVLAGCAISLILPYVLTALQFSGDFVAKAAATQTIEWCATFFGMLGAIQPMATAVVDKIIPDKTDFSLANKDESSMLPAATIGLTPTLASSRTQSKTVSQSQATSEPSSLATQSALSGKVSEYQIEKTI